MIHHLYSINHREKCSDCTEITTPIKSSRFPGCKQINSSSPTLFVGDKDQKLSLFLSSMYPSTCLLVCLSVCHHPTPTTGAMKYSDPCSLGFPRPLSKLPGIVYLLGGSVLSPHSATHTDTNSHLFDNRTGWDCGGH